MNHGPVEPDGLLDDDPALDCILFEEMSKEQRQPRNSSGCLGVVIILLLPAVGLFFLDRFI